LFSDLFSTQTTNPKPKTGFFAQFYDPYDYGAYSTKVNIVNNMVEWLFDTNTGATEAAIYFAEVAASIKESEARQAASLEQATEARVNGVGTQQPSPANTQIDDTTAPSVQELVTANAHMPTITTEGEVIEAQDVLSIERQAAELTSLSQASQPLTLEQVQHAQGLANWLAAQDPVYAELIDSSLTTTNYQTLAQEAQNRFEQAA
jgi:hypothetical protein